MNNKSNMRILSNNDPSIETRGIPEKVSCHELYMSDILVFCLRDVSQKQTSRPYCKNHMPSMLLSISYAVYTLVLLFRKNYQAVLSTMTLPETALMFRQYFIKKQWYLFINASFQKF